MYVFISTLQGVVLGMGLWFKWKKRGQVDDDDEGEEEDGQVEGGGDEQRQDEERRGRDSVRSGDEQTPLLRSGN